MKFTIPLGLAVGSAGLYFTFTKLDPEKNIGYVIIGFFGALSILWPAVARHFIIKNTIYRISLGQRNELSFWIHRFGLRGYQPYEIKVNKPSIDVTYMTQVEDMTPRDQGAFSFTTSFESLDGKKYEGYIVPLNPKDAEVFNYEQFPLIFEDKMPSK